MNAKIITIDIEPTCIEPTWEMLCNASQSGHLPAKELMPACKIADKVRQAQKSGKKSIIFSFCEDGTVKFEVVE